MRSPGERPGALLIERPIHGGQLRCAEEVERIEVIPCRRRALEKPAWRTPPREGRHLRGACLPCCSQTDGRSAAQLVGSFVTNASLTAPLKVGSKAPGVVGKSAEKVHPVT